MHPHEHPSRRALIRGLTWVAPTAAISLQAPAFAASFPPPTAGAEYGLFVSTQYNGSYVGYSDSNNTGAIRPTSPTAYFEAARAGNSPESDINWNDASQCHTYRSGQSAVNGEGSFTPVTNSASGANGAYAS